MVIRFPLGILYAYLIKWIPFIYLNFFLTVGYGCAFGFMTGWLLQVRESAQLRYRRTHWFQLLAWPRPTSVGTAMFMPWSIESPTLITFAQLRGLMGLLYDNGSWGIGVQRHSVTGIPLAIVWFVEAAIIIGIPRSRWRSASWRNCPLRTTRVLATRSATLINSTRSSRRNTSLP